MTIKKEYKTSPSFKRDFAVLALFIIFLSILVWAGSTNGFKANFNSKFFTARMGPIYSLYGTVCLAYEFFTAIRNESNKTRIQQILERKSRHKSECINSMQPGPDRTHRIESLDSEIGVLEADLNHEHEYIKRKFTFGWIGVALTALSTFIQLP